MEALSFGIPVAATAAGGTGELVNDENGMLLDLDTDEEKLAQALEAMLELDEEAYNKMRENARRTWEERACAEHNYGNWCAALRE